MPVSDYLCMCHVTVCSYTHVCTEEGGGLGNDVLVEDCKFVDNEVHDRGSAVIMLPPTKSCIDYRRFRITVFRNKYVSDHTIKQKWT